MALESPVTAKESGGATTTANGSALLTSVSGTFPVAFEKNAPAPGREKRFPVGGDVVLVADEYLGGSGMFLVGYSTLARQGIPAAAVSTTRPEDLVAVARTFAEVRRPGETPASWLRTLVMQGVDDYLAKPVRKEQLDGALLRWVGEAGGPATTDAATAPLEPAIEPTPRPAQAAAARGARPPRPPRRRSGRPAPRRAAATA